jgi:hypothetical protein
LFILGHCVVNYTALNAKVTCGGKDMEGSGHRLIEVLFQNLPGRTEENQPE